MKRKILAAVIAVVAACSAVPAAAMAGNASGQNATNECAAREYPTVAGVFGTTDVHWYGSTAYVYYGGGSWAIRLRWQSESFLALYMNCRITGDNYGSGVRVSSYIQWPAPNYLVSIGNFYYAPPSSWSNAWIYDPFADPRTGAPWG